MNKWKLAALYAKAGKNFQDTGSVALSVAVSDYDNQKKIKYGNVFEATWGIFSEFFTNSSIHGMKYLGEQKRPIWERIFWISVFIVSIFTCCRLITNIYNKWDTHPVIVSFAEKSTPVWQIPFPTVTVCSETKSRPKVFNFVKTYWKLLENGSSFVSDESMAHMETIAQVCDNHLTTDTDYGFQNATLNVTRFYELLGENIAPFNETFINCSWGNKEYSCDDLLEEVLTEEGICYTFNSLSVKEIYREEAVQSVSQYSEKFRLSSQNLDWDLENGYKTTTVNVTSPKRVFGAGAKVGLYLRLFATELDYDYLCRGPVPGFKIALHTPGEVAQISKQYFRIPYDTDVLISVKANIISTSEALQQYDSTRRQCFFQRERHLRYFKTYTQTNCELECLSNFTLEKCGCVQFSMPRSPDTPVCGAIAISCLADAVFEMLKIEFTQNRKKIDKNQKRHHCNCLPACTSILYNAEISQADTGHLSGRDKFVDNKEMNISRLFVFFKEPQFLTSKRSELYGTTDFLANCGGLLGLFMGISALSVIEIIYFCSVRLRTNLQMRRRKLKHFKNAAVNCPQIMVDASCVNEGKDN